MRRRALLAAFGVAPFAGCSARLPTICSRPSLRADRLDFDTSRFTSVKRWWHYQGAIVATEPAHTERFEPPERASERSGVELSSDERAFIEGTDFEEAILVGVLVTSSGKSTDARITHVVREDRRVHCYVCIRRRGETDDASPQARLIRVYDSWEPHEVRVTFTDGNDSTRTFDFDGTRDEIAGERPE